MPKVEKFTDLKNIDSISWVVRENADGDCMFSPEMSAIRFVDIEGNYWNVPVSYALWTENEARKKYSLAETLLNFALSYLGALDGEWIGFTCSLSEAVNKARKIFPKKVSEEKRHFFRTEYIF